MNLEKAIEIAVRAHSGQKDKGGNPYIIHPLRVMLACEGENERIVSVLHDVVEDSSVTFLELRDLGFDLDVIEALQCLTRREGEGYFDFVNRICLNPLATRVKIRDILDNLDLSRLHLDLTDSDVVRVQKYHKALLILRRVVGG